MVIAETSDKLSLLSLKYKVDGEVAREIKLYGTSIDPNSSSIHDSFSISVEGEFINIPKSIYNQLHGLRKSFSYDELSGGIAKRPSTTDCLLAETYKGLVLEALYLTLDPDTLKPIANEMKPVFSLAINCLFDELYSPRQSDAREDARAALETLKTIYLIYQ